jgi:hypothetical protein
VTGEVGRFLQAAQNEEKSEKRNTEGTETGAERSRRRARGLQSVDNKELTLPFWETTARCLLKWHSPKPGLPTLRKN